MLRFLFTVLFVFANVAQAGPEEVTQEMNAANKACGTKIKFDGNLKEFDHQGPGICSHIFRTIKKACEHAYPATGPHPEGIAFIKKNVTNVSCKKGKDVESTLDIFKVTKAGTKITLVVNTRGGDYAMPSTEVDSAFSKVWGNNKVTGPFNDPITYNDYTKARTVGYLNFQVKKAMKELNDLCGSKINFVVDVPSWQKSAGALLVNGGDLDVSATCIGPFDYRIRPMCRDANQGPQVAKKIKTITCKAGPRAMKKSSISLVNGNNIVYETMSGSTSPYENNKMVDEFFEKKLGLRTTK